MRYVALPSKLTISNPDIVALSAPTIPGPPLVDANRKSKTVVVASFVSPTRSTPLFIVNGTGSPERIPF